MLDEVDLHKYSYNIIFNNYLNTLGNYTVKFNYNKNKQF